MRTLIIAALLLVLPVASVAQSLDSMRLASELGTILGSEAKCGFTYDQAAISAWIDDNTDPADMSFASTLQMMTGGLEFQFDGMSESTKTAHCRSVERTATHYGFLK